MFEVSQSCLCCFVLFNFLSHYTLLSAESSMAIAMAVSIVGHIRKFQFVPFKLHSYVALRLSSPLHFVFFYLF